METPSGPEIHKYPPSLQGRASAPQQLRCCTRPLQLVVEGGSTETQNDLKWPCLPLGCPLSSPLRLHTPSSPQALRALLSGLSSVVPSSPRSIVTSRPSTVPLDAPTHHNTRHSVHRANPSSDNLVQIGVSNLSGINQR